MKILITFSVIFLTLIVTDSVLSQLPTCGFLDFNDPSILNELQDCSVLYESIAPQPTPFIIESYSDSTLSPFRPESKYFLTTNKSIDDTVSQCFTTKALFRGNFNSLSFQIAFNLENNNDEDGRNDWEFFVSNTVGYRLTPSTDGWETYEGHYSFNAAFDDSVIGLRARIGRNSNLAVEFLKFYDRLLTDENCVPLYATSTSPPEMTSETTTRETETTTTSEPETPTTKEPETTTTPVYETPVPEVEVPACLEVDFNNATSLFGTFIECHLQHLPELIIKSYSDSTITPYRATSIFHLTNKWEGYSCLETIPTFSLTESSFIESAIFLNGVWPGAWIEMSVFDKHTGEGEVVKRLELENSWIRLSEEIKGSYSNAQITIKTNMNSYSQLAVEYFNLRDNSC